MKTHIEQVLKSMQWNECEFPWPTRRCEHWKYDAISGDLPLGQPAMSRAEAHLNAAVLCIDGHISIAPAWQDRITIAEDACVLWPNEDKDAHQFLMDYGTHPGIRLTVRKHEKVEAPLVIKVVQRQQSMLPIHYRHAIQLEEGASLKMMVVFEGDAQQQWLHHHCALDIGPYATLQHYQVHQGASPSIHQASTQVSVAQSAQYIHRNYQLSAQLNRQTMACRLQGDHASADLQGMMLGKHDETMSQIIKIWHHGEHSKSRQVYRSLVADKASSVWHSQVIASPMVKDICSQQDNKNLLVGDHAKAFTRPELAIAAHQVKCAHGATIGQMDDRALLYLRSRGYTLEEAQNIVQKAFLEELLQQWPEWAKAFIKTEFMNG
ncbi:MAG: SufD family Fe-S cluster assembly protein [Candidatus Comchoanobacterales bacterium]